MRPRSSRCPSASSSAPARTCTKAFGVGTLFRSSWMLNEGPGCASPGWLCRPMAPLRHRKPLEFGGLKKPCAMLLTKYPKSAVPPLMVSCTSLFDAIAEPKADMTADVPVLLGTAGPQ